MRQGRETGKTEKIAMLVAFACVLQIAESMIPHPVPGVRLGLPNMLTLTAMILLGFGPAMEVAVLRTLLSSFIMGTFMSPTFMLSFSGAVVSTAVMGLFYRLSGTHRFFRMSVVGISIVGAFTHNMVQLCLAYLLLVKHAGIFVFFPWLTIGAVATGWVVGVATGGVCRRLSAPGGLGAILPGTAGPAASLGGQWVAGGSVLHRAPAAAKLIFIFIMAVGLLAVTSWWFFLAAFLFLLLSMAVSGTPVPVVFRQIRRYAVLMATAFLLPVFFSRGDYALFAFGIIRVTPEGLFTGGLFASRIFLLLFASCLLVRTTSPEEISRGLFRILLPLELVGISRKRVVDILLSAWDAVPHVWTATRNAVSGGGFKRAGSFRNLIPLLSDLVAGGYAGAGSKAESRGDDYAGG